MDTSLFSLLIEYADEYAINEGLIKSYPIESVMSTFSRAGFKVSKKENKATIRWSNSIDRKWLNSRLQSLGWYPVSMSIKTKLNDFSGPFNPDTFAKWMTVPNAELSLVLEPKYDLEVSDYPKLLFHITEFKYWSKISLKGLRPSTKNKLTPHPERIYLAKSEQDARRLLDKMAKNSSEREFSLLQIDTDSIPQYFKLYKDPNSSGLFTLNTIPPYSIELIDTLFK